MTPAAAQVLAEIGLDGTAHRSSPATAETLKEATAIYAMTPDHAVELLARWPALEGRVELLDETGRSIEDPFGREIDRYRETRDEIVSAIRARVDQWEAGT